MASCVTVALIVGLLVLRIWSQGGGLTFASNLPQNFRTCKVRDDPALRPVQWVPNASGCKTAQIGQAKCDSDHAGARGPALASSTIERQAIMVKQRRHARQFSPEEVLTIRRSLSQAERSPMCPRCDRDLVVECSVATVMSVSWQVRCQPCHRVAFVDEVTGEYAVKDRRVAAGSGE